MNVDGTDFNVKYWSTFSKDDFVEQCLSENLYGHYPEDDRRALLEKVYELIKYESYASQDAT